ncbi:A-kinase anchor protein 17A isoform X2 [Teleopsis dalmanni]|nr:A-kinase anchor protein 17A isoform X2 [Teleopsis dalmanni]
MHISVALPSNKTGKSISNLEIMEKLSNALKPDKFLVLKVTKSTIDFIRFEAELDDRKYLRSALSRLDGISIKISGFNESFRVRASEPKDEFPTRYDWDSFFRDAKHMDEMKPGERPDTIHLTHLPIRWFCPRHHENDENVKPSESIFKRIFEKFGTVRSFDIPICDPYRNKMNTDISGMKTFTFEQDVLFEAYIQFEEYVGFVRAMDEFRGMKLVRKFIDKNQSVNIVVNFDKTKHLSDAQIQRRERVRKRLISKAQAEEEEKERLKKLEQENLERQRQKEEELKLAALEKQREREEKRKEKHLKKIHERGQVEISQKIRIEERKLLIAQRKLESIRILEQLFDRIKLKNTLKRKTTQVNHFPNEENDSRERLIEKYKIATEKLLNDQRKKVEDIKSKTPLSGLLKMKRTKKSVSSDDEDDTAGNENNVVKTEPVTNDMTAANVTHMNPFKAVAALAAASSNGSPAYPPEMANEWMKSMSMFPYVPPVFSGLPTLYRPPSFGVSMNYRGFAPRIRGRGRGRRGRGGNYDPYYHYKRNNYEDDKYDENDYYHKSSRNRSRSRSGRSRSRSRSSRHDRSRSRGGRRSRSRSYSRSSRSRSRSRSHHSRSRSRSSRRSASRSRSTRRTNKKLVSTRRSRSTDYSSHSRSRSRSHERSLKYRSSSRRVVIETDKLVQSAEVIKRNIEKDMKDRMREEEREIKENFRKHKRNVVESLKTQHKVSTLKDGETSDEEKRCELENGTISNSRNKRYSSDRNDT